MRMANPYKCLYSLREAHISGDSCNLSMRMTLSLQKGRAPIITLCDNIDYTE